MGNSLLAVRDINHKYIVVGGMMIIKSAFRLVGVKGTGFVVIG